MAVPAVVMVTMMAHKGGSAKANVNTSGELNPTFHDFLGMSCGSDGPAGEPPKNGEARQSEASPSGSTSVGASSGGGPGPISTATDLASERQMGNHLEGVPLYGPRNDLSGRDISNRFTRSKRGNSDSAFKLSSGDRFPQLGPDSIESSHLMKMLKNGSGGEQPRRYADEEHLFSMQTRRPTSASLALQLPSSGRLDANVSKFDRSAALNVGTTPPYPLRMGQFAPLVHQVPSNRYRGMNAGPSVISQSAADEGSRTGIKGSGIFSSVNACTGASEKSPSTVPANGMRSKPGTHVSEPESSIAPSRHGLKSVSRQMTIFYGGQAHVFDDVHPNKADVIMALAGSNGGSWSTTYSPKSTVNPVNESYTPNGEKEMVTPSNMVYSQEFRERLPAAGNSSHAIGSGDRIMRPAGAPRGCLITKGSRNPVQGGDPSIDEKK